MRSFRAFLLFGLLTVAGCFPIDLAVDSKGRVLIPRQEGFFLFDPATKKTEVVASAGKDQPVFARFSPNGKDVLLVVKEVASGTFRFDLAPLAGGKAKTLLHARDTAYVEFSPDGSHLAIVRAAQNPNPKFKSQTTELIVVPADRETDAQKITPICTDPSAVFRWFSDSKRLAAFRFTDKDEKTGRMFGDLCVIDVNSKSIEPIASGWADQRVSLDLSPDNKKVLLATTTADKPGEKPAMPNSYDRTLFEIDVAAKSIRKTEYQTMFVKYSPNGKRVLLVNQKKYEYVAGEAFSLEDMDVVVADASLDNSKKLTRRGYFKQMTMGTEGMTLPGWLTNDSVYFFVERATFGTQLKTVNLATMPVEGKEPTIVQPYIDVGVLESAGPAPIQLTTPKRSGF